MTHTKVAAACGLMIFALVVLASRQSGAQLAAISPQPAQRDRDKGLSDWLGLVNSQASNWNDAMPSGLHPINPLVNYTSAP